MKQIWICLFSLAIFAGSVFICENPSLGADSLLAPLAPEADQGGIVTPPPPTLATPVEPSQTAAPEKAPLTPITPTPSPKAEPLVQQDVPASPVALEAATANPSPPPMQSPTADTPREHDIYSDYRDYQTKEHERQAEEKLAKDREMFAHEEGEWDLAIDYVRNAYPTVSWVSPGQAALNPATQGGVFSLNYFPFHSLSFGRIGLGVNGGMFWSKFNFPAQNLADGIPVQQSNKNVLSIISMGLRLTYEFDYLLGQMLVPHIFVEIDRLEQKAFNVNFDQNYGVHVPSAQFNMKSFGGGLYFNLNRLEPVTASRALMSTGIKKFYLAYTALSPISGGGGLTNFLGLRLEF